MKVIIFSAPSGSGKSTIINYLMDKSLNLHFSISATSRPPRGSEQNGVEYFFISPQEFKEHIESNDFLEYQEVYAERFYGTLKSQVDNQLKRGENVVCDVDVIGALNIKKYYEKQALSIFIKPPSIEALRQRLVNRGTESEEEIEKRIARAEYELTFAEKFDAIVVNDDLKTAQLQTLNILKDFLSK